VKEKLKTIVQKLKTVKHIEIIIGVVAICVIVLIYTGVSGSQSKRQDAGMANAPQTSQDSSVFGGIEAKLASALSRINGAGKTEVVITFSGSPELVTANTINRHTSSTGTSSTITETISPIMLGGNPVILKEVMPAVVGVLVVAEGADNIKVRLELLRAVQTVLGVSPDIVQISAMGK